MSSNQMAVSDENLSKFCQLTQQNQEVVNRIKGKDVVMLMGVTGAGKSTTTNVLCGCKPVEEKIKNEHGYLQKVINTYPDNGFQPLKIGHTEMAETIIAGVAQDPISGVMYVDAMGHKDNRGWEMALANAANVMSIAKCCKSLKLMILIPATSVGTARGESIVEMLHVLEYFMQAAGGLAAFSKSILVLVTKGKTMEDVNSVKVIVHKENKDLKVVGLSFDDKNRARYQEATDETEYHPGTVEELKSTLENDIQAVSFRDVELQAPITDTDRQVLHKLQDILKHKVQDVGIDNIDKSIDVYNAFCFLQVIQCKEVDNMLENMQNVFLDQFQKCANTVSQKLNERNLEAALEIKNNLQQALQSIQQHSPELYQFIKEQKVLETCDHLIEQVQKFEEELKAEKIAKEQAQRQKEAAEQARRNAEAQQRAAEQARKDAEARQRAAEQARQAAERQAERDREAYEKAQEAKEREQEQRLADYKQQQQLLMEMKEQQRIDAEKRAEQYRQERMDRDRQAQQELQRERERAASAERRRRYRPFFGLF